MRFKRFPYDKDWNTIFGKDRAGGGGTETVGDAINDVLKRSKNKSPNSTPIAPSNAANSPSAPMASDADSDVRSRCHGETVTSPAKRSKLSIKRSMLHDGSETHMVNLMGKFLGEISPHMGEIKTNLGTEREAIEMRRQIHAAIKPIVGLTPKEKLQVTGKICEKPEDVELFLMIDDEEKLLLAKMIIAGEY